MANKNYGLIYSGMKSGISGAVAKGMKEIHNSSIIGIMPKNYAETKKEYIYDGCTEIVYTEDLSKRKKEMREKANAIIIVPGGVGGIAIILNKIIEVDNAIIILIADIILLTLSFFILGKEPTRNSILGSLLFPLAVYLTENINLWFEIDTSQMLLNYCFSEQICRA